MAPGKSRAGRVRRMALASGKALLAHTRLAILDTTHRADQPMHSADGRFTLVYNGEIYNFRELREHLEENGYSLRSTGDTEVILCLYEKYGPSMLSKLRGMFAIGIWDELEQELFLARDALGIKPLYYTVGPTFAFASQVRALLAVPQVDSSPDAAGHAGFFLWGSVPEPHTLYKGIRAFPPGKFMRVRPGEAGHFEQFADPLQAMCIFDPTSLPRSRAEMQDRLHQALRTSVRLHLRSDVGLAIFLSAGFDSCAIASLAAEACPEVVNTITLGFDTLRGSAGDEVPLAQQVAREWNLSHSFRYVDGEHFAAAREGLFAAMDQPTIDGVNSYFVSLLAKELGFKVALSGLGGDELFGGYPSFRQVATLVRRLEVTKYIQPLGSAFRVITAPAIRRFTSPKYAGLLEYGGTFGGAYLLRRGLYMPWELPDLIGPEMAAEGWRELSSVDKLNALIRPIESLQPRSRRDFLAVSILEMTQYMRSQLLRDTDWASMAHSVEVRVPLVDFKLLEELAPLYASEFSPRKADMIACLDRKLPQNIASRPKTGFAVPIREWLEGGETQDRGLRSWAKLVYGRFQSHSDAPKARSAVAVGA